MRHELLRGTLDTRYAPVSGIEKAALDAAVQAVLDRAGIAAPRIDHTRGASDAVGGLVRLPAARRSSSSGGECR